MCVCLRLHSRMFVWTMCTKNLSNYEITKIKVVDLHELFNFGIHYFFSWNDLGSKLWFQLVFFQISKFERFKFSQMTRTKTKVVDLDELNNFCINHFYIWNHLGFENFVWTCQILNFKMCKTLSHPSLIKLKCWSMILETFRKKKPSHLELVWGRTTSYKVYPQIKKRNHTVLDDPYMIIVNSVISFLICGSTL